MFFNNRICNILIFSSLTCTSLHAYAADMKMTEAEQSALPPYCARNHPEFQTHLCSGLNFLNRYYRAKSNTDKSFNLGQAVGELSYVINHFDNQWKLMPDAHLNRGLAYSYQKKWKQAVEDWNATIKLNPNSIMAYSGLIDYYGQFKLDKQAMDAVTEGLKHNPESKLLKRKYEKLGGQKPYPEPYGTTDQTSTSITEILPETHSAIPPRIEEATQIRTDSGAIQNRGTNTRPPDTVGSPTNPWCRFCPDTPPAPPAPTPSTPGAVPKAGR